MDKALKNLKELLAKLALMQEKIEQKVYDGNPGLLQSDYGDYVEADIEFQTSMDDHIDTLL